MLRNLIFPVLWCMIFSSCKSRENSSTIAGTAVVIYIQPFDGVTAAQTQHVYTALKKIYSGIEVKKPIPLPPSAYYPVRNRYRADSLIKMLSDRAEAGHKIIGLTSKDISTTKNGVADWGIMGLGFCPGKACIASTFRLAKNNINEQLFKVAIHEMGHNFGLPHCDVKYCFMRDAEGGNPTNDEKEFCAKCKAILTRHGWILK